MEFFLDFFEELDEMVYVADLETHELMYMNRHLRRSLGYERHEEYMGKLCYEVLQGGEMPCAFCTNRDLKPGKFVSWVHKNPVLAKRYLIKDSLISYQGKLCRIEIAIDVDEEIASSATYYYARSETILNECLQRIFSTTDPDKGLELILAYLGETFLCDRVYIFELDGERQMNNTYEWCSEGVTAQQEILQNVPLSTIDWWMELFSENKVVLIPDLEEIRTKYPVSYALLKPQNINTLAAGPISFEGRVVGFVGVDNPNRDMMTLLTPVLNVIGYFVAALLSQRDLLKRLNLLSFHDPLTGAFNRNAMFEHGDQELSESSAGDQLIRHCCDLLRETLETQWIYRAGGDEFVAVFRSCPEKVFHKNVRALHNRIRQDKYHMAVGYAWSDKAPFRLEALISQADGVMYQDKRDYYAANYQRPGIDRRRYDGAPGSQPVGEESLFENFLSSTYHDMDQLFRSMSQQNSVGYFYFGDMQKNLFYISDNMRDEFGFRSNVVPGLLQEWAQRISTSRFRNMYW